VSQLSLYVVSCGAGVNQVWIECHFFAAIKLPQDVNRHSCGVYVFVNSTQSHQLTWARLVPSIALHSTPEAHAIDCIGSDEMGGEVTVGSCNVNKVKGKSSDLP
jgi:hypothetical protein